MRYQLFIDGKSVDMYADESLNLVRQLKDFKDVSKMTTDYTQTFKIPASDRNNGVLSHWWNIDIIDGFDANKKVDAHIEIDSLQVFTGIIEVIDVSFTNGAPMNYSVTFYGDVKKVTSAMGIDTLQDLNMNYLNHTRNVTNIDNSWSGNLFSGKILYPVIAWGKPFSYGYSHADNIRIDNGTGVEIEHLRPSILLKELVNRCFENYGYTSQGTFYTNTYFDDLYVAPSAYAGTLNDTTTASTFFATKSQLIAFTYDTILGTLTETSDDSNSFNQFDGRYTAPVSGSYTFNLRFTIGAFTNNSSLKLRVFKNGTQDYQEFYAPSAAGYTNFVRTYALNAGDNIQIKFIASSSSMTLTGMEFECSSAPSTTNNISINMSELLPQMKVVDFLSQVAKTFNLVFVRYDDTRIDIEPYQTWLASGSIVDYTEYVDIGSIVHKKQKVPSSVSYSHKASEDFVNVAYRNNADRDFGSVFSELAVDFGTGELKVESPFTIVPPAILNKQNSSGVVTGPSSIQLVQMIDSENTPIKADFLLFYYVGEKTTSDLWKFESTSQTKFPVIAPYSQHPTNGSSKSVAFSLESSLQGNSPSNTLLQTFWLSYLSRIYSPQSRVIEIKATLPVGEWIDLKMNQTILFHGRYFKIEKLTYDLTTNVAKLSLFSYPDVTVWSAVSTGNSWNVTPVAATSSYIGQGSQSNTLGNVTPISGSTSTDLPNVSPVLDVGSDNTATP